MMKFCGVLLALLTTFTSNLCGHQDRILTVSVDGSILGLPEKYSPCVVDWKKNQIRFKEKVINLPDVFSGCFSSRFVEKEKGELGFEFGVFWRIEVSGSWFHEKKEEGSLPDYLLIRIFPENKDYNFKIFLDLNDFRVLGTSVMLTTFSKGDGDNWVNQSEKISDMLSSKEMELVLCPSIESVWEGKVEGVGP